MPNVTSDSFLQKYAPQASGASGAPPTQTSDDLLANYHPPGTDLTASPKQMTGVMQWPARILSGLVKGLAVGAGVPGDLEQLGTELVANPLARATGGKPEDLSNAQTGENTSTFFPTSGQLVDLAGRVGLVNRSDLIPGWGGNPMIERGVNTLAEGLGSAVPAAVLGPAAAVVPTLAAGAGGAAAGELSAALAPGSSLAPVAAGALAGAGGAALVKAWIAPTMETLASRLGAARTTQEAGAALQSHAQDWLETKLPAAEARVWSPVDQAMHSPTELAGPVVPLDNYRAALADITRGAGPLSTSVGRAQPAVAKGLAQDLLELDLEGVVPNWDHVRALRTAIGKGMVESKSPFQPIGQENLSSIYRGLTLDLNAAADKAGAGELFSEANKESTRLRTIAEQHIGPLVAPGVTPEQAAGKALGQAGKGGTNLEILQAQLPAGTNELTAAQIRMGQWKKLAPEAKAALVPDEGVRSRLDELTKGAERPGSKAAGMTLLHEGLGGAGVAEVLNTLSPHFDPVTAGLVGGGLAMLGPPIARGAVATARSVLRNPRLPLAGAVGGANALWPGTPQQ